MYVSSTIHDTLFYQVSWPKHWRGTLVSRFLFFFFGSWGLLVINTIIQFHMSDWHSWQSGYYWMADMWVFLHEGRMAGHVLQSMMILCFGARRKEGQYIISTGQLECSMSCDYMHGKTVHYKTNRVLSTQSNIIKKNKIYMKGR